LGEEKTVVSQFHTDDMHHNWTSYSLYNWSNITRWDAWHCGASLSEWAHMQKVICRIIQ